MLSCKHSNGLLSGSMKSVIERYHEAEDHHVIMSATAEAKVLFTQSISLYNTPSIKLTYKYVSPFMYMSYLVHLNFRKFALDILDEFCIHEKQKR